MNNHRTTVFRPDAEALQARFALRVTACLAESVQQAPHDVGERLRFARERALERAAQMRKVPAQQTASSVQRAGAGLAMLTGGSSWWLKLASVLPLVMLLAGLGAIEKVHDRTQISAAAEIDSALLADNLPPAAYRDPGFVEFLKTSQE